MTEIRERFANESEKNYQKFVDAVRLLGDKYILAVPVQKPEKVEWRL